MYYMHNGWNLYSREVYLNNHTKPHVIYFFSRKQPKSGVKVTIKTFQGMDFIVKENPQTGMPYIKKRGR